MEKTRDKRKIKQFIRDVKGQLDSVVKHREEIRFQIQTFRQIKLDLPDAVERYCRVEEAYSRMISAVECGYQVTRLDHFFVAGYSTYWCTFTPEDEALFVLSRDYSVGR